MIPPIAPGKLVMVPPNSPQEVTNGTPRWPLESYYGYGYPQIVLEKLLMVYL
jgi:hypothetical protein